MLAYYIGSFLVACLGIELIIVISRLEKLENAHKSFTINKAKAFTAAFSVSAPCSRFTSNQKLQKYESIHINGEDFYEIDGVFTSSTAGMYFFTATLVKKRDYTNRLDLVKCSFYKNDVQQLILKVDPTDDTTDFGSAAISNSVVLMLEVGDIVYLGNCNSIKNFSKWTSFSGFLLFPESS